MPSIPGRQQLETVRARLHERNGTEISSSRNIARVCTLVHSSSQPNCRLQSSSSSNLPRAAPAANRASITGSSFTELYSIDYWCSDARLRVS